MSQNQEQNYVQTCSGDMQSQTDFRRMKGDFGKFPFIPFYFHFLWLLARRANAVQNPLSHF